MPTLIDSQTEASSILLYNVYDANHYGASQSFTGVAAILDSCKFYLKKTGLPTGNIVSKVYAHTGTYGTSSLLTGAALAVSDNVNVATLSTSVGLITFSFSGANRITLVNGTYYVLTVEYTGGDGTKYVSVYGLKPGTATGNSGVYSAGWSAQNWDCSFYVYKDDATTTKSFTLLGVG